MRIAFAIGVDVMLAMHRDPAARRRAGREPEPEAHHVRDDRMQRHGAVRHRPMREHAEAHDGEPAADRGDDEGE